MKYALICFLLFSSLLSQEPISVLVSTFDNYLEQPLVDINFEYSHSHLQPYGINKDTTYHKVRYTLKYKETNKIVWQKENRENIFIRVKNVFTASVVDKFSINLNKGVYDFELIVTDLTNGEEFSHDFEYTVTGIERSKLGASELLLATKIQSTIQKNNFIRNGYFIVPNPSKIYDIKDKLILNWYLELYNLNTSLPLNIKIDIYSGNQFIRTIHKKTYDTVSRDFQEIGRYNLAAKVKTGNYTLKLEAVSGSETIHRTQEFIMHAVSYKYTAEEQTLQRLYKSINSNELGLEFEAVSGIVDEGVFQTLKENILTLDDKIHYLIKYWMSKPGDILESRQNFLKVAYYTKNNKRFREDYNLGKGENYDVVKIMLKYGFPERIERLTISTMEQAKIMQASDYSVTSGSSMFGESLDIPYERWSYTINDKVEKFYFGKETKTVSAEMVLLHTTLKRSRRYNPNWKAHLISQRR